VSFSKIIATGSYLPTGVVTNYDLEKWLTPVMIGFIQELVSNNDTLRIPMNQLATWRNRLFMQQWNQAALMPLILILSL